MMQDCE